MILPLVIHENLFQLPIESPELRFLIILAIMLFVPLILEKIHMPSILGLIIAGAVIGEHGFNIMARDSGIVMSGAAGLLYIMFLAGLEIDINEFIKNRWRSIVFGLYTFLIPMGLGTLAGLYLLHFPPLTSVLLASMFASHTLLAYPIISKMGVKRNRAVTVTIGGSVIAETLVLLSLAIIVGRTTGNVDSTYWILMAIKMLAFAGTIFLIFPIITRYFLREINSGLSQYVFILFMLFLGAILAQVAGVEGIIGALFTGLALNRQIPNHSALMNRIEFVGNAIFIPFFLIGVGMLIDYRVFLADSTTLYTAFIMTLMAIVTKYLAAYATQKSFGYTSNERSLIFGLSGAHAAVTLAVVMVGYNLILGYDGDGEPIRLFNASVLNGSIVVIFITCSVASITAQRAAHKIVMSEAINLDEEEGEESCDMPRVLLPINSSDGVEDLVNFANFIVPSKSVVTVASVISDAKFEAEQMSLSKKTFNTVLHRAASLDRPIETLLRYDTSYTNGISNIIRENKISDLVLNIDSTREFSTKMTTKISDALARTSSVTTFMSRTVQSVTSVRNQIMVLAPHAELEIGFRSWIIRVWSLVRATSASLTIYATPETLAVIKRLNDAAPISINTRPYLRYDDLLIITKELRRNDGVIFVLSHKGGVSYTEQMEQMPHYINNYFNDNNTLLIYPYHTSAAAEDMDGMATDVSINMAAKVDDVIESIIGALKIKH
ncbi:MAG: cation:proton antiporter [Rikenellaceae bacterium]